MATTLYDKNGKVALVVDARRVAGMIKDGFTTEIVKKNVKKATTK